MKALFFISFAACVVPLPGAASERIREFIYGFGAFAPVAFVLICVLKPILFFVPSLGLTVVAGALFGPLYGTLYVAAGGAGSTAVAFYMARLFGRGSVERFLRGKKLFVTIDKRMESKGMRTVMMMRLFNVPWDIVSYSAGLSSIGFAEFYLASMIFLLPVSYIFTNFGSAISRPLSGSFFIFLGLIILMGAIPHVIKRFKKTAGG